MPRPVEVQARPNYHLWVRYDDGAEGVVDLTDIARRGVFKAWDDVAFFDAVRIAQHGAIVWGEDIDLCPDAMYMRLTGKKPEEVFPNLNEAEVDA